MDGVFIDMDNRKYQHFTNYLKKVLNFIVCLLVEVVLVPLNNAPKELLVQLQDSELVGLFLPLDVRLPYLI